DFNILASFLAEEAQKKGEMACVHELEGVKRRRTKSKVCCSLLGTFSTAFYTRGFPSVPWYGVATHRNGSRRTGRWRLCSFFPQDQLTTTVEPSGTITEQCSLRL
ncbi:unnamed protein product, partial [Ascophyllum nodosum]